MLVFFGVSPPSQAGQTLIAILMWLPRYQQSQHSDFLVTSTGVLYNHTGNPDVASFSPALPPPISETRSHKRFVGSLVLAAAFAGCCYFLQRILLHNNYKTDNNKFNATELEVEKTGRNTNITISESSGACDAIRSDYGALTDTLEYENFFRQPAKEWPHSCSQKTITSYQNTLAIVIREKAQRPSFLSGKQRSTLKNVFSRVHNCSKDRKYLNSTKRYGERLGEVEKRNILTGNGDTCSFCMKYVRVLIQTQILRVSPRDIIGKPEKTLLFSHLMSAQIGVNTSIVKECTVETNLNLNAIWKKKSITRFSLPDGPFKSLCISHKLRCRPICALFINYV